MNDLFKQGRKSANNSCGVEYLFESIIKIEKYKRKRNYEFEIMEDQNHNLVYFLKTNVIIYIFKEPNGVLPIQFSITEPSFIHHKASFIIKVPYKTRI